MRKLELLDLDNSEVRDLSPLAGLTSLDCLSLNNTSVSDLAPLAKVPNLRKIWVRNTGVTKDQVDALQKALPNCKIDHDPFP
jgi:Leucine-rich repeat (LRR) protein